MHAASRTSSALLMLAATIGAAFPGTARGSRLGNPQMETLTAKIAPPYSASFNLGTAFSSWPPLLDVTYKREGEKDSTGLLYVARTFNTRPALPDKGAAMANDAGTFLSWAEMTDPHEYTDHVGVFSFTQWMQSFRKDAFDATYHFTLTGAKLYTRCLTTGARAEFACSSRGYYGGSQFYDFYQGAGLKMTGNPPFIPLVDHTQEGPMPFTGSNPDGIQRDYQLDFSSHTEYVDLSGIPVGGEFTIVHEEMTQGNINFDEVVKAFAYFRDPGDDSSGVVTVIQGLTPTDNPQVPQVGVAPSVRASAAALSPAQPNPASGPVTLRLDLPAALDASIGVYDLAGRRTARLHAGRLTAGSHVIAWDARDEQGARVPAGLYFVRVTGPGISLAQRVVRVAR